jgi:hypothetical protein
MDCPQGLLRQLKKHSLAINAFIHHGGAGESRGNEVAGNPFGVEVVFWPISY